MLKGRDLLFFVLMAGCSSLLYYGPVRADDIQPATASRPQQPPDAPAPQQSGCRPIGAGQGKLVVTVGKSLIIDSPLDIRRLSVANGDLAEAVAVNPKEVLINGKPPGETSLIVWQQNGARLVYDLTVRMSSQKLDSVRQQIARDFPDDDVNVTFENDTAFVRGTVKDMIAAERVMSIAATLGKSVNLLRVECSGCRTAGIAQSAVRQREPRGVDRPGRQPLQRLLQSDRLRSAPARRWFPTTAGKFTPSSVPTFCCCGPISTWRRPSRRCRASACSNCWPSRTCWRSAASRPASWQAASFRSPWCSRGREAARSASCGGNTVSA